MSRDAEVEGVRVSVQDISSFRPRYKDDARGEDVRIFRLRMTPANARVLLRE